MIEGFGLFVVMCGYIIMYECCLCVGIFVEVIFSINFSGCLFLFFWGNNYG